MTMVILLSEDGKFHAFEEELQAQLVSDIINGLQNTRVTLTMPRFEFDSEFSLKDTLTGMGMPVAFTENADFSGMTGKRDLLISDVIHKSLNSAICREHEYRSNTRTDTSAGWSSNMVDFLTRQN